MTHYTVLLKKQLLDLLPSRHGKRRSWSGIILSVILIAAITVAFSYVFSRFATTYTAIKVNRISDVSTRQFELMTIAFFTLLITLLFSGVNRLCFTLFESSDICVLTYMPFRSSEIFMAKLSGIYIRQLALSALFTLPVGVILFITSGTLTVYNVLIITLIVLLLPVIPLGIAAVIALPFYCLKRFISSRYLLSFIITTLMTVIFCVIYAYGFRFAENMLHDGRLASLFDEKVMGAISSFTAHCYPANLFANILLKRSALNSAGLLFAFIVPCILLGTVIIRVLFNKMSQSALSVRVPVAKKTKLRFSKKGQLISLIAKEFLLTLRTQSYSFVCFTTAVIMPLLVYCSAKLCISLLGSLLGGLDATFEICTSITLLYSTLTGTFCSISISKDGYMTMLQKTMPYSPAKLLASKLIFCGFISEISIAVTCLALLLSGIEQPADVAITFISATLFSLSQLAIGTRLDLNHPHFVSRDESEIKESGANVSSLIVIGIVSCAIIGVLLLTNSIMAFLYGTASHTELISYAYALALPLGLLAAAITFFLFNLKKTFANLDAEDCL